MKVLYASKNGWKKLQSELKQLAPSNIFVLTDTHTSKLCLPLFQSLFSLPFTEIKMKAGEAHKNIENVQLIWQQLIKQQADRKAVLLLLGGGTVSDVGGFAAATYQRGITTIAIPTTLMGMADAAIGGKTAINLDSYKNQIGSFHAPSHLVLAPDFLKTLAPIEIKSGLAEIVKHQLLQGGKSWKTAKHPLTTIPESIEKELAKSIAFKLKVVSEDPKEKGIRKILNFGHTIGHAIESWSIENNKKTTHGAAVFQGMWVETLLSMQFAGLSVEKGNKVFELLEQYTAAPKFSEQQIKELLKWMQQDKKNVKKEFRLVLLKDIGKPIYDCTISAENIAYALRIC